MRVAVIGAGPSGISAIKNFTDQGFEVTAFERCNGVGGIGDLMIHQDIQVSLRLHISLAQNIHLFMKTIRFQNLHQTTPHIKNYLNILMVMQIILILKKILNLELK